jgi:hypothetical protein
MFKKLGVTSAKWMRTTTEVFSSIFPVNVKIKVFEPSQIYEAQNWFTNTP